MRLEIHVSPGASGTRVGGSRDGALVVRVTPPAEGGRATAAALVALADALGVRPGALSLVRGATSRRKLVDVSAGGAELGVLERRVADLLGSPAAASRPATPGGPGGRR